MSMKNVGVLLPAYNEERNIGAVISEAKKSLPGAVIVVVDDGSRDNTRRIAQKSGVRVYAHAGNRGKGEALRSGLKIFNKEFKNVKNIVIADADRQYSIKEAGSLLKPLLSGQADFVMGKRDFSKVPFRHMLGNLVWRTAFNFRFKTDYPDTNCGFIAMTNEAANAVVNALGGGYIIENALLIEARKHNFKIKHVDVSVTYKKISGLARGITMVAGVLVFIFSSRSKYLTGKVGR